MDVGWVNGKEPRILGWLKKMGKLGAGKHDSTTAQPKSPPTLVEAISESQSKGSTAFSTFPSTFVSCE